MPSIQDRLGGGKRSDAQTLILHCKTYKWFFADARSLPKASLTALWLKRITGQECQRSARQKKHARAGGAIDGIGCYGPCFTANRLSRRTGADGQAIRILERSSKSGLEFCHITVSLGSRHNVDSPSSFRSAVERAMKEQISFRTAKSSREFSHLLAEKPVLANILLGATQTVWHPDDEVPHKNRHRRSYCDLANRRSPSAALRSSMAYG